MAADAALAEIVRRLKADSGTIHFMGADGMLHLAAATPGFPESVLKTIDLTAVLSESAATLMLERKPA
jgi:hypothetical protein